MNLGIFLGSQMTLCSWSLRGCW